MKINLGPSYRFALLGSVILSLSSLNAQGQTIIRRSVSRQVTLANGQTARVYSPYTTAANYGYLNYVNPAYANANYTLNRSLSAAGTYTQANRAIGAAGAVAAPTAPGPPPQAQPSDSMTAQYTGSSQLLVQWSGNSNGVLQVKLAVFDADFNMLDSRTITQLPVVTRFAMTADIAYYGAQVVYASGKVTTTYQPIQ